LRFILPLFQERHPLKKN